MSESSTIQFRPGPFARIVQEECAARRLNPEDVVAITKRVKKHIGKARAAICYRLWAEHDWSFSRIARYIRADHTTVIYHVRKHMRSVAPWTTNTRVAEYARKHGLITKDQPVERTRHDRAA